MKYILLVFFLGCSPVQTCVKWEAVPSSKDCIEWAPHPLDDSDRLVCIGRAVCRRCIETQSKWVPNPFSEPWDSCENPIE